MKHYGLIGHPLGHSLSPQIHARIMEAAGIGGDYRLFDIAPGALARELPALMRSLDGFNCTIPHKTAVLAHIGSLAESARRVGAVNTVDSRTRTGHNTDLAGFEASCGLDFRNARALLLGAGGAARAFAACALAGGAASLAIAARNAGGARALAESLCGAAPGAHGSVRALRAEEPPAEAEDFDIIMNSTPLGMWPDCGGAPLAPAALLPRHAVFDAVYNPAATRLVLNARKRGARASGGLRMLVRQAVEAQRVWNPGAALDAARIEADLLPWLARELLANFPLKILLTGFMGAGKSTAGRLLAARLGFAFVDLDEEAARRAGRAIPEIFAASGEAGFRAVERAAAAAAFSAPGSGVIASGGGFPAFAENRALARARNALVFDLDLPFDEAWRRIHSDTARPLARDCAAAEALHRARAGVYAEFCDYRVDAAQAPDAVADAVLHGLRA